MSVTKTRSQCRALQELAHRYIPGGAHTYSRGDDQFPANAPAVLARGEGAFVWDADGNKFLDYGMALGAITLGYNHPKVSEAAIRAIRDGNHLTRPSVVEVRAAEAFCAAIPGAEMVKFGKNGSTVTTAAVKLARAHTGRKLVLRSAQDHFYSYDDWFIGSTVMDAGIPPEISALTKKFDYNDPASLERLFEENPGQVACLIMEPMRAEYPKPARLVKGKGKNFLHDAQHLCRKHGAVFILDEMISGFRFKLAGGSAYFGITPDLMTFGKGMGNGFSVAALAGKREIMELGGLHHDRERVFLISTTHGSEMSGLAAFMATLEVYQSQDVCGHMWRYGERLIAGFNALAKELGISACFGFTDPAVAPGYFVRGKDGKPSLEHHTIFSQEMIRRGVLFPWLRFCLAHGERELEQTLAAGRGALEVLRRALDEGAGKYLEGPAIKPVFRKRN